MSDEQDSFNLGDYGGVKHSNLSRNTFYASAPVSIANPAVLSAVLRAVLSVVFTGAKAMAKALARSS